MVLVVRVDPIANAAYTLSIQHADLNRSVMCDIGNLGGSAAVHLFISFDRQ